MFHPYRSTEPHKIRKNLLFFTYSHLQNWIDSFSLIQILQFQSQCFHFTQIVMSNLWHDNCALFQKSQFNLTDFNPTFFDVPKMKRVNNVWSFSIFRKKLNSNSSNQIQLFFNLKKIQNLIWKTKFTFFYLQKKYPIFFDKIDCLHNTKITQSKTTFVINDYNFSWCDLTRPIQLNVDDYQVEWEELMPNSSQTNLFCKNYEIKDSFHRQELYLLVILQNKLWIFLPKWVSLILYTKTQKIHNVSPIQIYRTSQNQKKSTLFHLFTFAKLNWLFFPHSNSSISIAMFSLHSDCHVQSLTRQLCTVPKVTIQFDRFQSNFFRRSQNETCQ